MTENELVTPRSLAPASFLPRRFPAPWAAVLAAAAIAVISSAAQGQAAAERCAAGAAAGDHRACSAAVAARPDDAELRRLYAISLQQAGLYDRSLRQYARVAALTPGRFRAQYELGWMLAFVRRYPEAVVPLERAARLRPAHAGVYRALTIAFAMIKQPDRALRSALAGAALGDRIAMYVAARHYRNGLGIAPNRRLALRWLRRAAKADHVRAMEDLARVYLYGELGEAPDDKKAVYWATEARRARQN